MRLLTLVVTLVIGACHHDAPPPVEPAGTPPLPPASGTPIGYLIDDAGELKLDDNQVTKLRDIDNSLAAQLEVIDAQTRAANRPADDGSSPPAAPSGGRHGGGRRGGMGGGSMPSGGGGGSSGRHHKRGTGAGSASPTGATTSSNRLADERSADVRDALQRAFALLDPGQQQAARKVLATHDVDLDVGTNAPPPQLGSGDDNDPAPEP